MSTLLTVVFPASVSGVQLHIFLSWIYMALTLYQMILCELYLYSNSFDLSNPEEGAIMIHLLEKKMKDSKLCS